MRRLLVLAALVMFIFALIAASRPSSGSTFLSTAWPVWLSAGFVAWAADQVLGGQTTKT
jgi:hypothetical protein